MILEEGKIDKLSDIAPKTLYMISAILFGANYIFSTLTQLVAYWSIKSLKEDNISLAGIIKSKAIGLFWVNLLCAIIIYLGFIMLVVPAIVLSYFLFASGAVYLIEEKSGFSALRRSAEIMKLKGTQIIFNAALVWLFVSIITSFYIDLPYRIGQVISSGFTSFWFFSVIYLLIEKAKKN
jgi:hypothetical protein